MQATHSNPLKKINLKNNLKFLREKKKKISELDMDPSYWNFKFGGVNVGICGPRHVIDGQRTTSSVRQLTQELPGVFISPSPITLRGTRIIDVCTMHLTFT